MTTASSVPTALSVLDPPVLPMVTAALLLLGDGAAARRLRGVLPARRAGDSRDASHASGAGRVKVVHALRASASRQVFLPVALGSAVGLGTVVVLLGSHGPSAALTVALGVGAVSARGCRLALARGRRPPPTPPTRVAAGCELLAAGLRAGLPPTALLHEMATEFDTPAANGLREVSRALALGADPDTAWESAVARPETAELARAARRSAGSGSGLARVAEQIAVRQRAAAREKAMADAERAAVRVTAPLGLCFLPSFFCLGVLPIVLGMVQRLQGHW
ncbi:Type II secretion system (T2SS), protein F [Actinopolyspora alba]|uniref:Type II secretion system (T2SS), protein F n=1 Tax=Actinopolyspora alba TaxID=673379 RepID=A0A1I1VY64_9ACTN|nr:type II secretion system F family protein [Actinopolyspora alba]SFD87841.1 Type II secretion system (T2SS), protein F [Actinopolyspora alba]